MSYGLSDLPIEIIQRIASLGPCDSALTLLRVNKRVYRACNDRQVFKEIIRNGNGYDLPAWQAVPLSNDAPASSWARYALADLRAREWFCKDVADQLPLATTSSTWMPQLAACFHPCLLSADKVNFYNGFQTNVGVNAYAHAFVFAVIMMYRPLTPTNTNSPFNTILDICEEHFEGILRAGQSEPVGRVTNTLGTITSQYARAVATAGAMIEYTRNEDAPIDQYRAAGGLAIDFPAMLDLPLPFASDAAEKFATCHLAHMTAPQYLEDGQWMGFYSTTLGSGMPITRASFDEPMRDVSFTLVGQEDSRVKLVGVGTDGIGSFELHGTISSDNGVVSMDKVYDQGTPSWKWDGFMTPFGMVGTWGSRGWGGWFWLYKKYEGPQQSRSKIL